MLMIMMMVMMMMMTKMMTTMTNEEDDDTSDHVDHESSCPRYHRINESIYKIPKQECAPHCA